jgi:hypothetical protein
MAGTWTAVTDRDGYVAGAYKQPRGLGYECTADAAAATIPDLTLTKLSGWLCAIDVLFDATTAVDSLTITPKTIDGVDMVTAATGGNAAMTGSGQIPLSGSGSISLQQ